MLKISGICRCKLDNRAQNYAVVAIAVPLLIIILMSVAVPYCEQQGYHRAFQLLNHSCSFLCHQLDSRSIHLGFYKIAICSRCFSVYVSMLMLCGFYYYKGFPQRGISITIFAVLVLPLVIDGGTQYIGFRTSNNALRIITGTLAGLATAAVLLPALRDVIKYFHHQRSDS